MCSDLSVIRHGHVWHMHDRRQRVIRSIISVFKLTVVRNTQLDASILGGVARLLLFLP